MKPTWLGLDPAIDRACLVPSDNSGCTQGNRVGFTTWPCGGRMVSIQPCSLGVI